MSIVPFAEEKVVWAPSMLDEDPRDSDWDPDSKPDEIRGVNSCFVHRWERRHGMFQTIRRQL